MWGSGGTASPFLTSALRGGECSASRPDRFTSKEIGPGTQWIGGWVVPRTGLYTVKKRKRILPCRESNPGRPAHRYTDSTIGVTLLNNLLTNQHSKLLLLVTNMNVLPYVMKVFQCVRWHCVLYYVNELRVGGGVIGTTVHSFKRVGRNPQLHTSNTMAST
jgi:hypothetical protein